MVLDYLIIGRGIAGTVLAHALLQRGRKIRIIDSPALSASSKIAAGLYNPIVFKRLVKSWKVDELLPFAIRFYSGLEKEFNVTLHHARQIVKIFAEDQEKDFWIKRSMLPELEAYLAKEIAANCFPGIIHNPLGCATVESAGNINVNLLLEKSRDLLLKLDSLTEEKFDYNDLKISDTTVNYKHMSANRVIFCEGYRAKDNPYFKWLPFKASKGELLTVEILGFNTDKVINKGIFILPTAVNRFKIGSTYSWDQLDETPTVQGKREILEKLDKVLKIPYMVSMHEAGIRPTVKDRRPLIGKHPVYGSIGIFNGMGTKAVLIAPYFADQLINFFENNAFLDEEVNITRYYDMFHT